MTPALKPAQREEYVPSAAEAACGGPVDRWQASIRYSDGSHATHDFALPAGATENEARYWAWQSWRLARCGRDGEWADPSLKVRLLTDSELRALSQGHKAFVRSQGRVG